MAPIPRYLPTILSLILLSAHLSQSHAQEGFPTGEWAIESPGGETTGVLEFQPDGSILSKADENTGEHIQLKDGRTLIVLGESVLIGQVAKFENVYAFQGTVFQNAQPTTLQITPATPAKLAKAKKYQSQLKAVLEQNQKQQLDHLIRQNLAALASAFQMYMLIEGKREAIFPDVVGPGKYLPQLASYRGESYQRLNAKPETKSLSVTDADGNEYTYDF